MKITDGWRSRGFYFVVFLEDHHIQPAVTRKKTNEHSTKTRMLRSTEIESGNPLSVDLVPHLCAVFSLDKLSQVNIDPVVLAVACLLKSSGSSIAAGVLVDNGSEWFPSRSVHSIKQEADRMIRFSKTYPDVFDYNHETSEISLKTSALFSGSPHPCDEMWYTIVLHRLLSHNPREVNLILDELEVSS